MIEYRVNATPKTGMVDTPPVANLLTRSISLARDTAKFWQKNGFLTEMFEVGVEAPTQKKPFVTKRKPAR